MVTEKQIVIKFEEYDSIDELVADDAELLRAAQEATFHAYAPYSQFHVGAAARLIDGSIHTGANQENASFPVGMCAEQTLMMALTSQFKNFTVDSLAVSYNNWNGNSDTPISPCGKCRQFLNEFEERLERPIRVIMGGLAGKVRIVSSVADLLPLSFGSDSLSNE